jgi:ribosome-associated protein
MSDHLNTVHSAYSTIRANAGEATSSEAEADSIWKLVLTIAAAAEDRKGADLVVLKVAEVSYLADYFVLITGFSRVQVRAISQGIQQKVEQQMQRHPRRTEGEAEGTWVLLDYGDAIVHIMMAREREFYNLEAFWGHAECIELPVSSSIGK